MVFVVVLCLVVIAGLMRQPDASSTAPPDGAGAQGARPVTLLTVR